MITATFETTNRKLENFLYMHDVLFTSYRKGEDGMTVWTYTKNDELMRIVNEYKEIAQRRAARRN